MFAVSGSSLFNQTSPGSLPQFLEGLPWWAMTGDTVSIRRLIRAADSIVSRDTFPALRAFGELVGKAARGYLALSPHDSAGALRFFTQYSGSVVVCFVCNVWRLTRA